MDWRDFYIFVQVKQLVKKYAGWCVLFTLLSCNITKKVPKDAYLFRDHDFKITYEPGERVNRIDKSELDMVARIRPTEKWLFTYIPLRLHNAINQERLAKDIEARKAVIKAKNIKKLKEQERKNAKRIEKARQRGDTLYKPYRAKLIDTIKPRTSIFAPGFSVRYIANNLSTPPVILNPNAVNRTTDQIRLYLEKKGYYQAQVSDSIYLNPKVGLRKRKRQATVEYYIHLGKPHLIDTVRYEGEAARIHLVIRNYLSRKELLQPGSVFDRELLDGLRIDLARELRNETFYEFSPNHIIFKADTTQRPYGVSLTVSIKPRTVRDKDNKDSIITIPQRQYKIGDVFFHVSDSVNFPGNYSQELEKRGLSVIPGQFLPTLDTLIYEPQGIIHADRRKATFLYNGEMNIRHDILEMRNYLEHNHWYRSYYLDRSYNQLLELDVFQTIQPVLIERRDSARIDVHYYLIPSKMQVFGFEPRATNSNGFLGVSAAINYRHKNVFKMGGKFTASLAGGFENQPAIAESNKRSEETYEIGPTMKLVLPGLIPISYLKFSKRQTTSTEFSTGFNYQRRREFDRQLFQFNYLWRWRSDKLQTFQMGLPLVGGFKFVRIDIRDANFQERIDQLNDLFLKNAYSNQFIFNDFKLIYNYSNERILEQVSTPKRTQVNYDLTFDLVGNTMNLLIDSSHLNTLNQKTVFGIPFSQFVRIDNDVKIYQKFSKGRTIAFRLQGGLGYTYGNSKLAMPFDYGFFAGGSNDNRGWRARELSPGSYQYHKYPSRTITQIGDMRLGASVEYRFNVPFVNRFKGALFTDAGNIWTLRNDPNRPGSQISTNFFKEIAIAAGAGLRLDLSFLIIRFDVGVPIHNPAMSPGAQWIWNPRTLFEHELVAAFPDPTERAAVPRPFTPKLHFGIGFPF